MFIAALVPAHQCHSTATHYYIQIILSNDKQEYNPIIDHCKLVSQGSGSPFSVAKVTLEA